MVHLFSLAVALVFLPSLNNILQFSGIHSLDAGNLSGT